MSVPPEALSFQTAGPCPMRLTTINGHWQLWLPEHRAAREQWATGWERERLDAMHALIRPGDVVYDIGAEEGDLPGLWALWGAQVVLVEPNPRVWPNIRAIFEANGLAGHVEGWFVGFCGDQLRQRPAWDAEHVDPAGGWPYCAAGPVIGDHGFLVLPERPDCPATTVDLLARQYGPPTVITIDVEGAELTVLRGAHDTLAGRATIAGGPTSAGPTLRPAVYVSIHLDLPWIDEKYPGDTEDAVFAYMAGLGYEGRRLAVDHELHVEFLHPEGRRP